MHKSFEDWMVQWIYPWIRSVIIGRVTVNPAFCWIVWYRMQWCILIWFQLMLLLCCHSFLVWRLTWMKEKLKDHLLEERSPKKVSQLEVDPTTWIEKQVTRAQVPTTRDESRCLYIYLPILPLTSRGKKISTLIDPHPFATNPTARSSQLSTNRTTLNNCII